LRGDQSIHFRAVQPPVELPPEDESGENDDQKDQNEGQGHAHVSLN
jgi:hypothetical protein